MSDFIYYTLIGGFLMAVALIWIYAAVRAGSFAWFRTKMDHHRRVMELAEKMVKEV